MSNIETWMGILVGGGPAPGINGLLGAATIEAINQGMRVRGFYDGFKWLSSEDFDSATHSLELKIPAVARVHFEGGSILRTSRASLLDDKVLAKSCVVMPDENKVRRVVARLQNLRISNLITIGGDDTALSARFVADHAQGKIRVVHGPKTIDNDLPLPADVETFGYGTARHLGAQIVANLMQDSKTTQRWYLVVAMGRNAGFLALGIGKAAGATITLIPEEFPEKTSISQIADVLECSILKRRVMGRSDGVAVIAEGLAYKLGDREELERIMKREIPMDAAGHPRLAEVPLDSMLKSELKERFRARGESLTLIAETLGYELRSAAPTPRDMSYTRDLGHGAVRMLLDHTVPADKGVMVTLQRGHLTPVPFSEMIDPATNRTCIRTVDLDADTYRVARAYMIRLEKQDLENPGVLSQLAAEAHMKPQEFKARYATVVHDLKCSPPRTWGPPQQPA